MEINQARCLIGEMFHKPFDKERFQHFIRNLLNNVDESKAAHWNKTYVKEAFRQRIKKFERVASFTDPEGEKLDVLIIHLERESSLERARTSLHNFAADYLTTGHGQDKSAVLAAFVSPDPTDWRFSFVKLEYETARDDSGKIKVNDTLSPARRYSFLVGANEHSHTAQTQFLPLLEHDDVDPFIAEIEKAFDIEKVTTEFFKKYKALFESVRDALDKNLKRNAAVREDFDKKGIETDDFAKKLLGQIVFLYFLQKKGWFGVDRGAEWGTGNKRFLRYLFENRAKLRARPDRSSNRPVNFFNDVLEHLFYDALARERDDDYYPRFDCRIPFLNGGLFEPLWSSQFTSPISDKERSMKISYDPEVDALSIIFRETTVTSKPLAEGITADYACDGRLAGLEVLDAVKRFGDESTFKASRNRRNWPVCSSRATRHHSSMNSWGASPGA